MNILGVVVVAAGNGSRMKSPVSKQYLMLGDKPVLNHTLELFQAIDEVAEIVVVVGQAEIPFIEEQVISMQLGKVKAVVAGGSERQSSVYQGLLHLSEDIDVVMVHDGVRPFVSKECVVRLWEATKQSGAAVLAVPVKETIKVVGEDGVIESTPERAKLWSIQTPQAFRKATIIKAHEEAAQAGFFGTDDAMLVERLGIPVQVVEGDYTNIKLTTPDDLSRAESILKERNR